MLLVCTSVHQLEFSKIAQVYRESILKAGAEQYPYLDANMQCLEAEQDFYQFLCDFFHDHDARYYIWAPDSVYKAALRTEVYRDGILIAGLETAPENRRRGFAGQLMSKALSHICCSRNVNVYSHIHKGNAASIAVHLSNGFVKLYDHAVFIDGSVDHNYDTYIKKPVPN